MLLALRSAYLTNIELEAFLVVAATQNAPLASVLGTTAHLVMRLRGPTTLLESALTSVTNTSIMMEATIVKNVQRIV